LVLLLSMVVSHLQLSSLPPLLILLLPPAFMVVPY
jgi:hypothetical protein